MQIAETVRVSLGALRANALRSLLTMLGIVIGVGSVIAMVAIGNGAQRSIEERMARLGTTFLQVNPQRQVQGGIATASLRKITQEDAAAVAAEAVHVTEVNAQQNTQKQITWKTRNTSINVVGSQPNYLAVRKYEIEHGVMFTDRDERARRKVAVLAAGVGPLLGVDASETLLGEKIRIAGQQFLVIGVMKKKGQTGTGSADPDEQIVIPLSTGRFIIFGHDRLNDINALATSEADIDAAMAEITLILRRQHRLRPGQADDFVIRNQTDFLVALNETTATFKLLLAGIAAVSLVVGGIGIMNIMLVSVTERTREIGVRKALGARRSSIRLQFLSEAVILCLCGGALGIVAGVVGAAMLTRSMGWQSEIDLQSIIIAFGFASATGLVFGVWPAHRAAGLDPVEAMRSD